MVTKYTCHSEDVSDEPITYETESISKAAELYVEKNLEFDPIVPQSVIQVEVAYPSKEFENKTTKCYVDVTIVLDWHASAAEKDHHKTNPWATQPGQTFGFVE